MSEIYKCQVDIEDGLVLAEMRDRIAQVMGVTLQGNRLTVRWYMDDQLVDAHMVILSVTNPDEARKQTKMSDISSKVWRQHPKEDEEMFFLQHGEYPT